MENFPLLARCPKDFGTFRNGKSGVSQNATGGVFSSVRKALVGSRSGAYLCVPVEGSEVDSRYQMFGRKLGRSSGSYAWQLEQHLLVVRVNIHCQ